MICQYIVNFNYDSTYHVQFIPYVVFTHNKSCKTFKLMLINREFSLLICDPLCRLSWVLYIIYTDDNMQYLYSIALLCNNVSMEFQGCNQAEMKGAKNGRLYLTTHRMIFNNRDTRDKMQSFSFPFVTMSEVTKTAVKFI